MTVAEESILRTLAFHAAWGYAPTRTQLFLTLDQGEDVCSPQSDEISKSLDLLFSSGQIEERFGKLALKKYSGQIEQGREKEASFPRKLKKARRIARYLRALPWVRAVFLCNTAALGQTSDKSDLDFFIIARQGAIWRTRLAAVLPFLIFGDRPGAENAVDPVCLSFFIADNDLDLSSRMLDQDDPYFRFWFLYLLPLREDGILEKFWYANRTILSRHPNARTWLALDSNYPKATEPLRAGSGKGVVWSENIARRIQEKMFPQQIKEKANLDTNVMIDDHTLKFHIKDNRQFFKDKYYQICKEYGVRP